MKPYFLYKYVNLMGESVNSDNYGQNPQLAKSLKYFVNRFTGELVLVTDLQQRKNKRNQHLDSFIKTYSNDYNDNIVSILGIVVNVPDYPSISKFLDSIKKKLKRKNIQPLGYVWVRDLGERRAIPHYHIMLATTKITSDEFKKLFSKKRHSKYEVQLSYNPKGLKAYIKVKELYGGKRQRAFGRSKEFKKAN
jgi:hypothetical protein